ncbi:MAG: T9SS type A sorting domain-containing protein, partial [Bacteroidia bacterium]|nr:T9SS type A sorting domain-containing protein [Bacteroidia bacterium]
DNMHSPAIISLTDISGKTVHSEKITFNSNFSDYAFTGDKKNHPGVYYLTIDDGQNKIVKKLLKKTE